MSHSVWRSSALALTLLAVAGSAAAHHPPRYERCVAYTFEGDIERIDWSNPHVQLFIREADGTLHRLGWLDLQALRRAGIDRDTLAVGDRVIFTSGLRPDDVVERPELVSSLKRPSDGWAWSQPLQGC